LFDDRVRTILSFEQWATMSATERTSLATQRIAESQPSWRGTHLANALIAAAETIEDAEKREVHSGPRRIVLISDMQEGSRLQGLQGYEWPRGVELVVEPVKSKRPTNAGLQWVVDTDDSMRSDSDAAVRIRVSNSADATREQFRVGWAGVSDALSLDAYVPPGQSRSMPAPKFPVDASAERIVLSGDENDFDNVVYVVQSRPDEISVRFLGSDAEDDPAHLLYYLKRAFQDTRRQAVRLVSGTGTNAGAAHGNDPVADASNYRLLIVDSLLPERESSQVRQFLNNGGTVLFVMNDAQSARTLGQLTGVSELQANEAAVANYAMFGRMDFTHPLFAPFLDPRFGDFTKIRFWKHRTLSTDRLPDARVIASFDDDDPAVLEVPVGRGRVFVFTFSWKPVDSQFALSSKFVPLLYSLLDQAGGGSTRQAQFRIGDTVDLTSYARSGQRESADSSEATTTLNHGDVSIRKPDGSRVQLSSGDALFAQTDEPGLYEISVSAVPSAGSNLVVKFAVNLDATESRTSPLAMDELERLGVPVKSAGVTPDVQTARRLTVHNAELETRQKLWRWLIVAALTVLLVETWLAGRITRTRQAATSVEAAT
jgi:hypothetical protein